MSDDAEVKRVRRVGWLKTIAIAGVSAIAQLVQVLRADAESSRVNTSIAERLTQIESKLDAQSYELRHLSERITILEAKK